MEKYKIGICCFCENDCNPNSQSCGKCSRLLTGHALGWNNLPDYLNRKVFSSENKDGKNNSNHKSNTKK